MFDLGIGPVNDELFDALTRLENDYLNLGVNLIETSPVPITQGITDVSYRLTPAGKKFIRFESRKNKLLAKKDVICSLKDVINKNGFMDKIDLYASWVYISDDLDESETIRKYYFEWYDFDEKKASEFRQAIREISNV